jgi:hypothetical protein
MYQCTSVELSATAAALQAIVSSAPLHWLTCKQSSAELHSPPAYQGALPTAMVSETFAQFRVAFAFRVKPGAVQAIDSAVGAGIATYINDTATLINAQLNLDEMRVLLGPDAGGYVNVEGASSVERF